jgi:hypothetical protein
MPLCGFCQCIHEERLDRLALACAVAAVVGIEIAASYKLVELTLRLAARRGRACGACGAEQSPRESVVAYSSCRLEPRESVVAYSSCRLE